MWSYSTDPSTSPKDEVRFLLGDTNQNDPLISDEEINYLIGKWSDPYICAAMGAEALSAKYASLIDRSVGSLSISYSQRSQQFADLAKRLRQQARSTAASSGGAGPQVFGIAWADKDEKDADTTLIPDTFDEGFMDNPGIDRTTRTSRTES